MANRPNIIYGGCRMCHINCGVACEVDENGRLLSVEPTGPEHHNTVGKICLRAMAAPQLEYSPTRIEHPMKRVGKRGEGKWERIS